MLMLKPFDISGDLLACKKILPADAKILYEHPSARWFIVGIPNMTFDDARQLFAGIAGVGICEQQEYWRESWAG